MKVKRNTLLLLACLVWSAAGFNILRIGLMAYPDWVRRCCWRGCCLDEISVRRPGPLRLPQRIWKKKEYKLCRQ